MPVVAALDSASFADPNPRDLAGPGEGLALRREPKQERSRRKQEALIDAAESLFAERGYSAVTAEDIALAAGFVPGTFYNYFTSKTQVFIMVADRHERPAGLALEPIEVVIAEGGDLRDAIRGVVRDVLEHKQSLPWLRRIWCQLLPTVPEVAEYQRKVDAEWEGAVVSLLDRIDAQGRLATTVEPTVAATVIRSVVEALTDEAVFTDRLEPTLAVEATVAMIEAALLDEPRR